jgi:hypothetical protein
LKRQNAAKLGVWRGFGAKKRAQRRSKIAAHEFLNRLLGVCGIAANSSLSEFMRAQKFSRVPSLLQKSVTFARLLQFLRLKLYETCIFNKLLLQI